MLFPEFPSYSPDGKPNQPAQEEIVKIQVPETEQKIVFRVVNGLRMGQRASTLHDQVENMYATPHPWCVRNIIRYNDEQEQLRTGNPYDTLQYVVAIQVLTYHHPRPDHTFDPKTDTDEVVVDQGKVVEVIELNDFLRRYPAE